MSIDKDLIHRLTLEELAEVISDEDLVYLKTTIREHPEAFNIWMETRSVLDTPDVKEFLSQPRPVENIFLAPHRRRGPGFWAFALSVAALFVVSLGIYLLLQPENLKAPTATVINKQNIQLQLSGGQHIDLSQKQGTLQSGDVNLNNTNKSLTYTSATPQTATLTIPAGKDYQITLSDGTTVWLNSATTLEFPTTFTGKNREITLNGEAYLTVAKNTKPFIVHLPTSTVEVLGTEFNINTYDKTQVALVNGSVQMKANGQAKLLTPGKEITYTPADGMQVTSFDADLLLSWRKGLYIFNNTPLGDVIKVFPRWFGKEVLIDSPMQKNARFTGVIDRNQPIGFSLDLLKIVGDFDYAEEGGIIHIK